MELLTDPNAWVSFGVLTLMEIVLGIDNIVFITILCGRLPEEQQLSARRLGLAVALLSRLVLLASISWVMGLEEVLFTFIWPWSGKSLILMGGGLFLLYKATREIYENVERPEEHQAREAGPEMGEAAAQEAEASKRKLLTVIVLQVMVLDIVFSLDSVITAVGMADELAIMAGAVIVAVGVMLAFAGPIGDFVQAHPSVRVLALAFLVLIGSMLMAEATGHHVSKGYIYSAMGFSLFVQILNLRMDSRLDNAQQRALEAAT